MKMGKHVGRDKIAAGLAMATILLLGVLFYAVHRHLVGLEQEIDALQRLHSEVVALDNRHTVLENKVTELATLPRKTQTMVVENQLKSMEHAVGDLDQRLDDKHRDKLAMIRTLLGEISTDLHEAK
ncbi:hypothetical protein MASR1M90_06660 [Desulfovibrionales bacterium]